MVLSFEDINIFIFYPKWPELPTHAPFLVLKGI